jgi:plexin-like protein
MSTCQSKDGCLEFVETSTCPSGICQDETTCATAPNCGSFTTCDTCTAPMQINCFWCPTTSSCVATSGNQDCMGGSVGGNDSLNICAEVASCAPCSITTLTVCADTQFQCSCPTGKTPGDNGCVLDANQQYCCAS